MQRVVITGLGLVSCLGNDRQTVTEALKQGRSGITFNPAYAEMGLRSQVSGTPQVDLGRINRKLLRFMGDAASFGYLAALDAIEDAGLTLDQIASNPRIGVVAGSGGGSTNGILDSIDTLRNSGIRRVAPTYVPRTMTSTVTAGLATGLKIQGVSYAISSACATSAHCIGHAAELIQLGKQDIVLAGGGEEEHWTQSLLFDAMGAMSSHFNDDPAAASRPYAANRNGFVIAGGAGMLVVESLEHAQARGARILAELVGYAAASDGADMVAPNGDGASRCMQMALEQAHAAGVERIDYLNTHGTATPLGDTVELDAMRDAFAKAPGGYTVPPFSSTKSMTGHSLGAAGAQEAIYCLLMQEHGFIAPSINSDPVDERVAGLDLVQQMRVADLDVCMSNSFGFGGTNATLILRRWA